MTQPRYAAEYEGDFPDDWQDPVENPDLPWIQGAGEPDPVPVDRLADEPETVQAEEN